VIAYVSVLQQQGFAVKYISFVGHSFGGLVSRYAIGILFGQGFFDRIKPMNFTTFATPHLGVRRPPGDSGFVMVFDNAFNFLAPILTGSKSGTIVSSLMDLAHHDIQKLPNSSSWMIVWLSPC
jgi:Putative serine esterase (DUF676)